MSIWIEIALCAVMATLIMGPFIMIGHESKKLDDSWVGRYMKNKDKDKTNDH